MSLFSDEKCRKSFSAVHSAPFQHSFDANTMICAEPTDDGYESKPTCWVSISDMQHIRVFFE